MTKGLMDRALHHETALERVRDKARQAEEELLELKNWKVVTDPYLGNVEEARLPHGLRRVVPQVLVVLAPNDGRDLHQSIFWIFAE